MNYQTIYNRIIESARSQRRYGYTETHHILPRCLGGSDDKENLVSLTAREHFICHRLLVKIHPSNKDLKVALFLMSARAVYEAKMTSKLYTELRSNWSESMKKDNPMFDKEIVGRFINSRDWSKQSDVATRRNMKYWTEQNRKKLSDKNRELWSDPVYKAKRSATNKAIWTPERRAKAAESARNRWAKKQVPVCSVPMETGEITD